MAKSNFSKKLIKFVNLGLFSNETYVDLVSNSGAMEISYNFSSSLEQTENQFD